MTKWEAWQHEEVQGRVRALLVMVDYKLLPKTVAIVGEMIDHNECGIALEIISELLVENGAWISRQEFASLSALVNEMGLDQVNIDRLRSRVDDDAASSRRLD